MRIIKRKKGNMIYYYLQHSYRDKKVITKELYLGKNIPKNIEEIKEKLMKETKKNIYIKLENIKKNFQKIIMWFTQTKLNKL